MSKYRTHYDNLKVARNAPDAVIRAAYKALMQQYHPDKFKGTEQEAHRIAKLIRKSYEILIDPDKRAEHNQWINEQEAENNHNGGKEQYGPAGQAKEQHYQNEEKQEKSNTNTKSEHEAGSYENSDSTERQFYKEKPFTHSGVVTSKPQDFILYQNKSDIFWTFVFEIFIILLFLYNKNEIISSSLIYLKIFAYIIFPNLVLSAIYFLSKLFSISPTIVIDEIGIKINFFGGVDLKWPDVSEARINYYGINDNKLGEMFLEIHIIKPEFVMHRQSLWHRIGIGINRYLWRVSDVIIIRNGLVEMPLVELVNEINSRASDFKRRTEKQEKPEAEPPPPINRTDDQHNQKHDIPWRMVAANFIVMLFIAYITYPIPDDLKSSNAPILIFIRVAVPSTIAVIVTGIFYVFRKKKEGPFLKRSFIIASWVFLAMVIFGESSSLKTRPKEVNGDELSSLVPDKNNLLIDNSKPINPTSLDITDSISKDFEASQSILDTISKDYAKSQQDEKDFEQAINELIAIHPELGEDGPAANKVLALLDKYRNDGMTATTALRKAVNELYPKDYLGNTTNTEPKVSVNFQQLDINSALQLLAGYKNIKISVSNNVDISRKITMRIKNEPWSQVLDKIMLENNLKIQKNGNVYIVSSNQAGLLSKCKINGKILYQNAPCPPASSEANAIQPDVAPTVSETEMAERARSWERSRIQRESGR